MQRLFWIFLEAKYFSTSLAISMLLSFLLRRVDWSSRVHSFVLQQGIYCSTTHIQEHANLKPFLCSCAKACVKGNRSNLSTRSCKSWRPFSFWNIDVDDGEVFSKSLNLLNWSLNSEMSGCVLVGKLLERVCWWDLGLTGEAAIVFLEQEVLQLYVQFGLVIFLGISSIYILRWGRHEESHPLEKLIVITWLRLESGSKQFSNVFAMSPSNQLSNSLSFNLKF